jgi:hypothetical protein
VTVCYDNDEEPEIDKRMSKGSKAMGSLNRMITSREISREAKIWIYRTVVRPAVVYGCETWVLTKNSEIKLEAWERKMLRKIFKGTRTEDGGWRRKTNREIKELYRHSGIVQHIKAQRIRWLGHVGGIAEQRYAKRALLEREE